MSSSSEYDTDTETLMEESYSNVAQTVEEEKEVQNPSVAQIFIDELEKILKDLVNHLRTGLPLVPAQLQSSPVINKISDLKNVLRTFLEVPENQKETQK